MLEASDVDGFLTLYERYVSSGKFTPEVMSLTQSLLPTVLMRQLGSQEMSPPTIVKLWRLVRGGQLLLIDNDLRARINAEIDSALNAGGETDQGPAVHLAMLEDTIKAPKRGRMADLRAALQEAEQMHRVAVVSTFNVTTWSASDAFDYRKNLCASHQERQFLVAVSQYFPSLKAYPNVPLRNFIDADRLGPVLPQRCREYLWRAELDVLLCTPDEDPVAGIELDSSHHDTERAQERDELKNMLFMLAGMPLVRIRAGDTSLVRAEDFYDLLQSYKSSLESIRPRRLRPRRTHDGLAPAGTAAQRTSTPRRKT